MLRRRRDIIDLPECDPHESTRPSFFRFIMKLKGFDVKRVEDRMREKGIACFAGGWRGLHNVLGLDKGLYPQTEALIADAFSPPLYPALETEDVDYIAKELLATLEEMT